MGSAAFRCLPSSELLEPGTWEPESILLWLAPSRRRRTALQCHLEAAGAVLRNSSHRARFCPRDDTLDYQEVCGSILALGVILKHWLDRLGSSVPAASQPQIGGRGRNGDESCSRALRGRPQHRPPRRTMLRGKSRLNVEWLGYSPGLLLERRPLLAGRTPRSPGR
ncbi:hypothetical protein ABFV05_020209 [Capra hircus]